MKRTLIIPVLAVLVAGSAMARPMDHEGSYVAREVAAIVAEEKSRELAAVTIGDLETWQERIAAASRKDALIARSGFESFLVPGVGQLKNRETGLGALFLGSHLAIGVGSLLGSYFLLPQDLRLDRLDYLRSSAADIETAWKAHSLLDYLPAVGVCIGGHLLEMGLRVLAAGNARHVARERIDRGEVTPGTGRF